VIKIAPPGGDPFRHMASYPLWTRGKTLIEADLHNASDVDRLLALIKNSDAVVTTLRTATRARIGLNRDTLGDGMIVGVISGFGDDGPYRDYPGYEPIVAAKFGRMRSFERVVADRDGPNYAPLSVATHATAQSTAAALLAALYARQTTGRGAAFDTSLLRGLIPYEMGGMLTSQLRDKGLLPPAETLPVRAAVMPTLNYHPVYTKDGRWLQFGNLLPHLFASFLQTTGLAEELTDAHRGDPMSWDPQVREAFRDRMLEQMQTRTLAEWMQIFVQDGGVVAHGYQSTQQALSDPDVVENGHVVSRDGVTMVGPVAQLTKTPGEPGGRIRMLTFDAIAPRESRQERDSEPVVKPLAGVIVVECATIIAAPLGATLLADLGARVIKVEPLTGDPFRSMYPTGAAKCNAGKESFCVDLKSPEGRDAVRELSKRADIWIHNYRMGVPEKLGIGYDDLATLNPDLVYVSANGYGPNGPGARRPSTHPIPGAAMGGALWHTGPLQAPGTRLSLAEIRDTARRLNGANELNPDPNMSMVVATAALLGLLSGTGQKIYIDMFGANAYANWDDFVAYPGKPERVSVDANGYGVGPLQRLYRCKSGWVMLMIVNDHELAQFGSEVGRAFDRNDPDLAARLEAMFADATADEWEAQLAPKGLGCVRADGLMPHDFLLQDPHA
ncbi:MAG TPA: CoA transferase, partial [Pseudomonadales bacterium]